MLKHFQGKKKNKVIALACAGILLLTTAALMIAPTFAAPSDLTETFSSPFSPLNPQSGTGYEYIAVGETRTLSGQGTYRWQSTNPDVVDVQYSDANRSLATVTGISPGAGSIINSTNGGAANSRNYAVGDPNNISYYRIPMGTAGLSLENPGDNATIPIYVKKGVNPDTAVEVAPLAGEIKWHSDDTAIATVVEATGQVTAVADGAVVIRGDFTDPWGTKRTISYPVTIGAGGTKLPGVDITGITVTPPAVEMNKGGSQTFTATVQGTGSSFSQNVTWELTGNVSPATSFNSANSTLTIASNETASNMLLVAKTENPYIFQIIPITVPENIVYMSRVQGFTVSPNGIVNVEPSNSVLFIAEVFPKTLDQSVTWEIIGPAFNSSSTYLNDYETKNDARCQLMVGSGETPKTIWLRATCAEDLSFSELITINIGAPNVPVTSVTVSGVGPFYRGGGYQFTAAVQPSNATNQNIVWTLEGNPTDPTTAIDANGWLTVGANETKSALTVKATSANNVSGTLSITVNLTGDGGGGGTNPVKDTPVGRSFWLDDIEWMVLMRDGNKALVISRDIIGCRPFEPYDYPNQWPTWQFSDMRMWLNGMGTYGSGNSGFINQVLSAPTRNMIVETELTTRRSKYTGIGDWSGNNPMAYETTRDKVFLLSMEEMFFEGVNNSHKYNFGAYALQSAQVDVDAVRTNKGTVLFNNNAARICNTVKYPAWGVWQSTITQHYWTRSPGLGTHDVYLVNMNTGHHFVYYQYTTYFGVRPAMWLDASKWVSPY